MSFGSQLETGRIRSLLLKHPRDAFRDQAAIDSQWRSLNYPSPPDLAAAVREYDAFVEILSRFAPEIQFLPPAPDTGLDSIYVRDPVVITEKGAVLCRMGKELRRGEPCAAGHFLENSLNIPILGEITGEGLLEGGDMVWLDSRTVAIGEGYRTNAEGIRQFTQLARSVVDKVITVPLPHWHGPSDVLHVMSFISPVAPKKALVYSRLMPVSFRTWLLENGFHLVEVPDEEYESMACNVLALADNQCLMLSGNPVTRRRLEEAGVTVMEYKGNEISQKGAGGPTCLTRPIWRE